MKTTQPADIGLYNPTDIILSEIIYVIFLISVFNLKPQHRYVYLNL